MTLILGNTLEISNLKSVIDGSAKVELSVDARHRIEHCFNYLQNKINGSDVAFYGINTGFGSLCNVKVSKEDLSQLQTNLVMSHACGMGAEVAPELVRLMLILKVQSLSYGHSGVKPQTVDLLLDFYRNDLLPVVYSQGSLGASGDLAPLAHLCLPLLGMGEVIYQGVRMNASEALKKAGLSPITLDAKEGLALLNGTQFMSALGVYALIHAKNILLAADAIAALSAEGWDCRKDPYHEAISRVRPHDGQVATSANMRRLLEGSEWMQRDGKAVQDPYSFRCVPQVHGASKDAIAYVESVFTREINSVTDNPLIMPDEDLILSGGNFHGQVLALASDHLALALHELGNISERRTYLLISGQRGLPHFLVKDGGLNSGFMIPQYTAAAIVSRSKQLCTPCSADSIVSSNGQEDHVSMGANAAVRTLEVLANTQRVLGIELLTAAQAFDLRKELTSGSRSSKSVEAIHEAFRKEVSYYSLDRQQQPDMQKAEQLVKNWDWTAF